MQPKLSDLEIMARQAGEILRAGFGKALQVDYKDTIDLVTDMDHRAEEFLLNTIQQRFPGHRIVAEESGIIEGDHDHLWYVDPLDGTVNYAHGIPIFSVSLAYYRDNQPVLGVVYNPMTDECFSAERGQGAFLSGRPLLVSKNQDLAHSLLVTGFPYDSWTNPNNNINYFSAFSLKTQGVRRLGSAALDLCYVAAGRFDGYWEMRLKPWDAAAGVLIVQEAGGLVTDMQGGQDFLSYPLTIIASNPILHAEILAVIKKI
ncbi:MAG: inositol monophosphatase [Anaerolineae bacterium]|nr:inositol monophosphatase [Anaerolineae bacterium]